MAEKILMKGNEAIAEAAIAAGCRHYFGYPITPQTEITEHMAKRMPQVAGVFLQAESEIAAINMVYGAAGAGARVMTSSSSLGISLKQEGISYIAGAELPCVVVNIMRGGPGLGSIQPAQADYFQATKGGGHGDYNNIVLAPYCVQEFADLTMLAFELADQYRNTVIILGDGALGQMMEPVEFKTGNITTVDKAAWAANGLRGRSKPNVINSLYLKAEALEQHNIHLQQKYAAIKKNEVRYEKIHTDDAELILVAYGITARIACSAMEKARAEGMKVGLFRPITLWPFPQQPLAALAAQVTAFLTLELSAGQMVEDVRLAVNGVKPVHFYGRMGGMLPSTAEIYGEIVRRMQNKEGK
jgi:2-oxoglutarate ferredoxin oxidoreductase subunit alpha